MNMKKLAFTGVLALVVIGCVLAAGCTSTSTSVSSEDQIVGIWGSDDEVMAFLSNNTGGSLNFSGDTSEFLKTFTWKKNSDGTYAITESGAEGSLKITVDAVKGQLILESGAVLNKQPSDASGATLGIIADKVYDEDGNVIGYIDAWGNEISLTPQSDD